MEKNRFFTSFTTLILTVILVFSPVFTSAATSSVAVNAIVPSKISVDHSDIQSSGSEVMSDGSSKIAVTVKTNDVDGNPLEGVPLVLKSSRGVLDWIENVTAESLTSYKDNYSKHLASTALLADMGPGVLNEGNGLDGVKGVSDANGMTYFRVYSAVPGESVFTAVGDNLVTVGEVKIKYDPLPFPANLTLNVQLPSFIAPIFGGNNKGEVTIIKPQSPQIDKSGSVNLGMKITIPFWVILLISVSLIANFFLLILLIFLSYRIRWVQSKEVTSIEKDTELLEKEEKEIEILVDENSQK